MTKNLDVKQDNYSIGGSFWAASGKTDDLGYFFQLNTAHEHDSAWASQVRFTIRRLAEGLAHKEIVEQGETILVQFNSNDELEEFRANMAEKHPVPKEIWARNEL